MTPATSYQFLRKVVSTKGFYKDYSFRKLLIRLTVSHFFDVPSFISDSQSFARLSRSLEVLAKKAGSTLEVHKATPRRFSKPLPPPDHSCLEVRSSFQ